MKTFADAVTGRAGLQRWVHRTVEYGVAIGVAAAVLLGAGGAVRAESDATRQESVPKTFEGAGGAFREGGHEIGAGFRSMGRGIAATFTGRRASDHYRESKQIGTGFVDIGRGVAGGARAVGRAIKQGVSGEGSSGAAE
jgi:hypothetical protein